MLVNPDFEKENSLANKTRAKGKDFFRKFLQNYPQDIDDIYERLTAYPKQIMRGVFCNAFASEVLSNDWQLWNQVYCTNFNAAIHPYSGYGYADDLNQLEPMFQYLNTLKNDIVIFVYNGVVNKEKPWKDGHHINGKKYPGKMVLKYDVLERR